MDAVTQLRPGRQLHRRAQGGERVLVMCHSHPRLTHGGTEVSAYALFEGLRASGIAAWFLGCSRRASERRLGAGITQPFGPDEYVYAASGWDHFTLSNRDPDFPAQLAELLQRLRPTVVHAHHYATLGAETFLIVRRTCPGARLVLTFHEFLAICNNDGQMVQAGSHRLCRRETPGDCADCFPAHAPAEFFLRKRYLRSLLDEADAFVAPSDFLARRYIAWGIPPGRIRVIENVPAAAKQAPDDAAPEPPAAPALRVGFFGQVSEFKGVPLLLRAARRLAELGMHAIAIHVFGDVSDRSDAALIATLQDPGSNVAYHGPYPNTDVGRLMRAVDVVVVPSIWWENSPVVIQEALRSRRPIVCSDVGGMAEKVRHELDGLHFRVNDAVSLADALLRLAREPDLLRRLRDTLAQPLGQAAALAQHRALYSELDASLDAAEVTSA